MTDKLLQGAEGDARRDVKSPIVQRPDLIMFDRFPGLSVAVPNRQRVAACGKRKRKWQFLSPTGDFLLLMTMFLFRLIASYFR